MATMQEATVMDQPTNKTHEHPSGDYQAALLASIGHQAIGGGNHHGKQQYKQRASLREQSLSTGKQAKT
jgi:hypothetical protein